MQSCLRNPVTRSFINNDVDNNIFYDILILVSIN